MGCLGRLVGLLLLALLLAVIHGLLTACTKHALSMNSSSSRRTQVSPLASDNIEKWEV
jgi:hypothetical protein